MRSHAALAAVLAAAVVPASAAGDFRRLAATPPDDDLPVVNGEVYVGSTPPGGFSALKAYTVAGGVRDVRLTGTHEFIEKIDATPHALNVMTITRRSNGVLRAYAGAPSGPLRPLPEGWVNTAVTGRTAVTLQRGRRDTGYLLRRDVAGGPVRRLALRGRAFGGPSAAGPYVAVTRDFASQSRSEIVVVRLRDGREVYSLPVPGLDTYRLLAGGRIVAIAGLRRAKVLTATPRRPRARTLARVRLHRPALAAARDAAIIVTGSPRGQGHVVKVGYDGRLEPLTPALPHVDAVGYDGRLLAFSSGRCVYGGPAAPGALQPAWDASCAKPGPF